MIGEFLGLFEREHVAAVFDDLQFRAGNFLGVKLADSQRQELVVAAPKKQSGAFDAVEVLRQARIVEVGVPADPGGGFAGPEPLEDAGIVE